MKDKLIALFISISLFITFGFKVFSYASTSTSGTVTAYSLNVRSGPGTSYSRIGSLVKGDKVSIVSKSGDWLKISYNKSYGYVSASYISSNYSSIVAEGKIVNCSFLNVRSGPGTGYSIKGSLANNTKVQIVDYTNGWYKIIYNSGHAYISATYVVKSEESDSEPEEIIGNYKEKSGYVNASGLNVREYATTQSKVLAVLTRGEKVKIVDETTSWYKIVFRDRYAYVSKNYIKIGTTQTITNLNEFLFVGDSFTSRIKYTINSNLKDAQVRAVGGAYPSYWLDNFAEMPKASSVKGVVLLIGTNGVTTSANLTDTKRLIDKLSEKYAGKMIFVQRVFPVGEGYRDYSKEQLDRRNEAIASFNKNIKSYCAGKSNVVYIDATKGFVDSNGYLINCDDDGLHILWSHNEKFFKNIQEAVIEAYY